jgi:protein-S-isoprenylcysteine O-methyltransferase Ste14
MKIIGKESIHPLLFYSGKISGYIIWIFSLLSILKALIISAPPYFVISIIGYALTGIGLIITLISLINLGKSTRLGLPDENTEFKTNGLYKFSRNPMYLGFNLVTIASVIVLWNIVFLLLGAYSVIIYHFIILSEEKYLDNRFSDKYIEYKKKVRRYV